MKRTLSGTLLEKVSALVALAAVTVSVEASAAPLLHSWLAGPTLGSSYWDCASRPLESEGQGFDSSGNITCFAHDFVVGGWVASTGNCAGSVEHRAAIRGNFIAYCTSPHVSWTTQANCDFTLATKTVSTPGAQCTDRTLGAYTQGTN